jgi:hypothetical protein
MAQNPEVALWRAVIQQAITDAKMVIEDLPPWPKLPKGMRGKQTREQVRARERLSHKYKNNRDEQHARNEARWWLIEAGPEFKQVCGMADIEPEYLTKKLLT